MKELIARIGSLGGPVQLYTETGPRGNVISYAWTGGVELFNVNEEEAQGAMAELLRLDMHSRGVGCLTLECCPGSLTLSWEGGSEHSDKNILEVYAKAWITMFHALGWSVVH